MSKQQYLWMLGLVAAWRQQIDDDQGEPISLVMDEVVGIAGRLRQHERQASNDIAACLFILLLIWVWNCANYRANLVNRGPVLCKLTRREFSQAILLISAWALCFRDSAMALDQCHSAHLPTVTTM